MGLLTLSIVAAQQSRIIHGPAAVDVPENTATTEMVADYSTSLTGGEFSLEGDDAAAFSLDATTGVLTFSAVPNFEAPVDADEDNVYEVTVIATQDSETAELAVAVTVTDVSPAIPSGPAAVAVAEGTTEVATYEAGGDLTLAGTDADDFTLADDGALTFNTAPDYEGPTDRAVADGAVAGDNVYHLTVVATDAASETTELAVTVTVTDIGPAIGGKPAVDVPENTATSVVVETYTSEPGVMWLLKPGGDSDDLEIDNASGELSFSAAPDYEEPADADTDNVYHVTVWATDGAETAELAVAVTVTDVGPDISGNAAVDVAENTTAVATYTSAAEGMVTWSLEGDDEALFAIGETSGELSFSAAPNYEEPADADTDNVYHVTVKASSDQGASSPRRWPWR